MLSVRVPLAAQRRRRPGGGQGVFFPRNCCCGCRGVNRRRGYGSSVVVNRLQQRQHQPCSTWSGDRRSGIVKNKCVCWGARGVGWVDTCELKNKSESSSTSSSSGSGSRGRSRGSRSSSSNGNGNGNNVVAVGEGGARRAGGVVRVRGWWVGGYLGGATSQLTKISKSNHLYILHGCMYAYTHTVEGTKEASKRGVGASEKWLNMHCRRTRKKPLN